MGTLLDSTSGSATPTLIIAATNLQGEGNTCEHDFYCRCVRGDRLLPSHAPRAVFVRYLGEDSAQWGEVNGEQRLLEFDVPERSAIDHS